MESVELSKSRLAATDCVVIVTNHDVIDYNLIGTHSKLVVDTRNAMASIASPKAKIVKA